MFDVVIKKRRFYSAAFPIILSGLLTACGGGSSGNSNSSNGDGPTPSPTPSPSPTPTPTPAPTGFSVGGEISGLEGTITLSLNGMQETFNSSTFTFTQEVADGAPFAVGFEGTDNGQICVVGQGGSGTISENIDNIQVLCSPLSNSLRFSDGSPVGHIAAGDFNRDTVTDLVFSMRTNSSHPNGDNTSILRVMWGNGVGAYTQGPEFDVTNHGYGWFGGIIISGRFDDNAMDDFAFTTAGSLDRFLGQNAADPIKVNTPYTYPRLEKMIFKDVTGDDIGDIVTFNRVPGNNGINEFFAVLPGLGNGNFGDIIPSGNFIDITTASSNQVVLDLPFRGASNLVVEDFNGDNAPDILARSWGTGGASIGVFPNNGSGTFDYPTAMTLLPADIITGENAPTAELVMATGDIDQDGDIDIVISSTTDFILTLLNDGSGHFTEQQRVRVGNEPVSIAMADLNFDDLPDLVSTNQESKTVTVSWNLGSGMFGQRGDNEEAFKEIRVENDTRFRELIISGNDIIYVDTSSQTDDFARGGVHIIPRVGLEQ